MSTTTVAAPKRRLLLTGLIVAAAVAAIELVCSLTGLADSDGVGLIIALATVLLALATLVLVPMARRGRRGPALAVAGTRVVASLFGLPAFFIPGVPAVGVIAAASGIVIAVGVAICVVSGSEGRA